MPKKLTLRGVHKDMFLYKFGGKETKYELYMFGLRKFYGRDNDKFLKHLTKEYESRFLIPLKNPWEGMGKALLEAIEFYKDTVPKINKLGRRGVEDPVTSIYEGLPPRGKDRKEYFDNFIFIMEHILSEPKVSSDLKIAVRKTLKNVKLIVSLYGRGGGGAMNVDQDGLFAGQVPDDIFTLGPEPPTQIKPTKKKAVHNAMVALGLRSNKKRKSVKKPKKKEKSKRKSKKGESKKR